MVDVANGADVDVGLLALEFTAGSSDCENAAVTNRFGGRRRGRKVEDGGGIEERGGELGYGGGSGQFGSGFGVEHEGGSSWGGWRGIWAGELGGS